MCAVHSRASSYNNVAAEGNQIVVEEFKQTRYKYDKNNVVVNMDLVDVRNIIPPMMLVPDTYDMTRAGPMNMQRD